jgi:hypothetical protein
MELEPIPRGEIGWKMRRVEILVMESMQRATTLQSGWHIWQKIQHKTGVGGFCGDDICTLMHNLEKRGLLEIRGCDDGDFLYKITS